MCNLEVVAHWAREISKFKPMKVPDGPNLQKNGEVTIIRLRQGIPELVKKYVEEKGVEEAGETLFAITLDELFITAKVAHKE